MGVTDVRTPEWYFPGGGQVSEGGCPSGGGVKCPGVTYQLDVDVVGGGCAGDAHHDGVRLTRAEPERDLISTRVRPRRLSVRERQQTATAVVASVAETISDAL